MRALLSDEDFHGVQISEDSVGDDEESEWCACAECGHLRDICGHCLELLECECSDDLPSTREINGHRVDLTHGCDIEIAHRSDESGWL